MQKLFDDQTITNTSRERSQLFDNEWGAGSSRTAMESKELSTQQLKLEQRRMLEGISLKIVIIPILSLYLPITF